MRGQRAEIIAQLQQDILLLQGFKPVAATTVQVGLGMMADAFPNGVFPTGAIHEMIGGSAEEVAATTGFIGGILGAMMERGGACLWIGRTECVFPPAFAMYGIAPERMIFIRLERDKDILWAMEEALQCEGLVAVVGEIREVSFTVSRRLQLAVERSHVTGFVLRYRPRRLEATACVARWQVRPQASISEGDLPGVGYPCWEVSLLKVRNGRTGVWKIGWSAGRFCAADTVVPAISPVRWRNIG
ncbi:Error-prone repair protein ImuA [Chitinophaga pendula]|nr:Error-prone repair protein ImuA [Chitinophaga pendula]